MGMAIIDSFTSKRDSEMKKELPTLMLWFSQLSLLHGYPDGNHRLMKKREFLPKIVLFF